MAVTFLPVPFLLVSLLSFLCYHFAFFSPEKTREAHVSDNSTIFCPAEIMKASLL